VSTVVIYFFVPETSSLALEEIGALFGDEVIVHMTADGHGLVEVENLDSVLPEALGKGKVVHIEDKKNASHDAEQTEDV
jgi:hypothetical protein